MDKTRILRFCKSVFLTAVALVCLIGFSPLSNELAGGLEVSPDIVPSDCIVVLGGGIYEVENLHWNQLKASSLERAAYGASLYQKGFAPKIILSTGSPYKNRPDLSEAHAMKGLLLLLGIPEESLILEDRSTRTAENAREVARLMRDLKYKDALLVTSSTHMKRSILSFLKNDVEVHPAPIHQAIASALSPSERLWLFKLVLHEYVGILYYRIKGWI